jgi:hypothetical protein
MMDVFANDESVEKVLLFSPYGDESTFDNVTGRFDGDGNSYFSL